MKEKEWCDFTEKEKIYINAEYERLNVLIASLEQGTVDMYKMDPRGARLVVDRVGKVAMSLRDKTEPEE